MTQNKNSSNLLTYHKDFKDLDLLTNYSNLLKQAQVVEEYESKISRKNPLSSQEFFSCFALILEKTTQEQNQYVNEGLLIHAHDHNLTKLQRTDIVDLINSEKYVPFIERNFNPIKSRKTKIKGRIIIGKNGFSLSAKIVEEGLVSKLGIQVLPRIELPYKEWDLLYDINEAAAYIVAQQQINSKISYNIEKHQLFKQF